ncbi:hypothetical protein BDV12DRAFT_170942 [Aspergillus spectabilis]
MLISVLWTLSRKVAPSTIELSHYKLASPLTKIVLRIESSLRVAGVWATDGKTSVGCLALRSGLLMLLAVLFSLRWMMTHLHSVVFSLSYQRRVWLAPSCSCLLAFGPSFWPAPVIERRCRRAPKLRQLISS